jgi:GNAT superfamily N-acetyltransferase
MADLIVKLYELPDDRLAAEKPASAGVIIRPAMANEKFQVIDWVRSHFSQGWAGECDVAFSNHPISCILAVRQGVITGFACYDSTMRNFFGPLGVEEGSRGKGIGTALLLRCLHCMAATGYAYAIIGGVGDAGFYARAVNAVEIPGSSPGVYRDRLQGL